MGSGLFFSPNGVDPENRPDPVFGRDPENRPDPVFEGVDKPTLRVGRAVMRRTSTPAQAGANAGNPRIIDQSAEDLNVGTGIALTTTASVSLEEES